jgi:hypothetical protein
LAFRQAERLANGGEVRIKNKYRRRYVGVATLTISPWIDVFRQQHRLMRINAGECQKRNILTLVGDLD